MFVDGSLDMSTHEGGTYNPTAMICPITVQDVRKTRGKAFLDLSPAQQYACGGSTGRIYQEGLRLAFEDGQAQGLPEIDMSDNMAWEDFKIWYNNNVRVPASNPLNKVLIWVVGGLLGVTLLGKIFD